MKVWELLFHGRLTDDLFVTMDNTWAPAPVKCAEHRTDSGQGRTYLTIPDGYLEQPLGGHGKELRGENEPFADLAIPSNDDINEAKQ